MSSIKLLSALLKTTPAVVNWVAFGSLLTLIAKILWLNGLPEEFAHAHELGLVAQDILAATVAAYIFFELSYQLPLVLERRAVAPTIAMLSDQVVESVVTFLYAVNNVVNGKIEAAVLPEKVTEQFVEELFAQISPNMASQIWETRTLAVLSWLDGMIDQDLQCQRYIDQIWRYSRFIDAELAALLEDIRFSQHSRSLGFWKQVNGDRPLKAGNADMTAWADAYFRYYQLGLRLRDYCRKFRATYGISATYGSFDGRRLTANG
jgi:hypothetical protein